MTPGQRTGIEAYLIRRTGRTAVEAAALSDEQLAEHVLAVNGRAVVSAEIRALMDDMERRIIAGLLVADCEYEAVLFAFWSGPISEYFQPKVFA